MERGKHLRRRLASIKRQTPSYTDELNKLPNTANDHLSLYTNWGGCITETKYLAFQSTESALLQETKTMWAELRMGANSSRGTETFAVRLRQGQHQEKSGISGIIEFDLIQDDWCQRFDLILPVPDIYLQEAGLFGGLKSASFKGQFKASLSERSPNSDSDVAAGGSYAGSVPPWRTGSGTWLQRGCRRILREDQTTAARPVTEVLGQDTAHERRLTQPELAFVIATPARGLEFTLSQNRSILRGFRRG